MKHKYRCDACFDTGVMHIGSLKDGVYDILRDEDSDPCPGCGGKCDAVADLATAQERIVALEDALKPIPEAIQELVHIATNHGVQYPHQERYVVDVMDLAINAKAALAPAQPQEDDSDETE